MSNNLSKNTSISKPVAAAGAGTSTLTGTVDMQGYDGVLFITSVGTAATNNGLKAGGGAASNGSDASDYAGSATYSDGTGKAVILDIYRPAERYVTVSALRGTSTTSDGVFAILYKKSAGPINNTVANSQTAKLVADPSFGTA